MKNRYWLLFICLLVPGFCDAASTGTVEQASVAGAVIAKTTSTVIMEKYVPQVLVRGRWGSQPGEFGLGASMGLEGDNVIPEEIVSDDVGNIYVLDSWNNRVQKFDANGNFLKQYPLEAYVLPTDEEFDRAYHTWNEHGVGFLKVIANDLSWRNGQLEVAQTRMPDININKYETKVLVLKSGTFMEDKHIVFKEYKKQFDEDRFKKKDGKNNQYVLNEDRWEKFNSKGERVFKFEVEALHKYARGTLYFASKVSFSKKDECLFEMKVFSNDNNDWSHVYLSNGGGMQIIRWCKK